MLTQSKVGVYFHPMNRKNSPNVLHFASQEELKIKRNLNSFHDSRVHVCLYFITPNGHGLKSIDLVCMKKLDSKVNIIPVIAKADTINKQEMAKFKVRGYSNTYSFYSCSSLRHLYFKKIEGLGSTKILLSNSEKVNSLIKIDFKICFCIDASNHHFNIHIHNNF